MKSWSRKRRRRWWSSCSPPHVSLPLPPAQALPTFLSAPTLPCPPPPPPSDSPHTPPPPPPVHPTGPLQSTAHVLPHPLPPPSPPTSSSPTPVWRITNKVGSYKCQTNHKVGRPFTEIVWPFLDEFLRLNNYFILSRNTFI